VYEHDLRENGQQDFPPPHNQEDLLKAAEAKCEMILHPHPVFILFNDQLKNIRHA
jgi:hypothetical protein